MEKLTSLGLTIDRVLIQLLIPGGLCALPFIMLANDVSPAFNSLLGMDNHVLLVSICTVLSLVTGILLENLGSHFEVDYIDVRLEHYENEKKLSPSFTEVWNQFLQLSYENEPVGQRYLRNLLVRLKFELSTGIALIGHSIGWLLYGKCCYVFGGCCIAVLYHLVCWSGAVYLLFIEAPTTARVLARTRRLLVERYHHRNNPNKSETMHGGSKKPEPPNSLT